MTTQEFNRLIKSGEAQFLTLAKARELMGKTIIWTYFGYVGNHQQVYESEITEIISEYEMASREDMKGYASRAAYWESYMSADRLQETKDRLEIIDKGKWTYMFCETKVRFWDEPTFVCSDSDRPVFFIVKS